jgi:Bacterial extracellular solute-binding protein
LSLNGGGPAGLYEPWVREFEQRFPGIKVKLTADFSNILAPIIDREIAERKLSVDLTIFQTLQDYDRWKKQGVLMSFRPEGWDQIHESFKDPDGQYVGVAVYALSYAYNTQAIAGIDVPRSAQDFVQSEFKGKVITSYPNDDDVTLYLFYTIVQKYGWEFMDKYMANNPQWVRGHLGTARAVASGQAAATFDTMTNVTLGMKKNNQPTDVAFSNVDPVVVGCSHPGVERIVQEASAIDPHINLLLGGLHQIQAPDPEVERIAKVLHDQYKLDRIAPGYCTGEPEFAALKKTFGDHYLYAGVGSVVDLPK